MAKPGNTARKMERNTVGMFQYIVMIAADTNGPSTMAGVNAMDIITATRKSARALATMQRHARVIQDARRAGDTRAAAHAAKLYARAKTAHENARADTRFPWER